MSFVVGGAGEIRPAALGQCRSEAGISGTPLSSV